MPNYKAVSVLCEDKSGAAGKGYGLQKPREIYRRRFTASPMT